ncbi:MULTISPECIES: hypothetical protein [Rhodococcus]|uniref:PE family protein n=1 Tax=Rhodococcus baikonurensis TaxID=172041 RepID=A0ABV5XG62_9NOCA|nr:MULTISPECIES: hypothetical protein [Rhodococcus]
MTQTYRPAEVFPDSTERGLRAMLAALDDALAAIADAREELRGVYTAPRTYPEELELFLAAEADNQDITTHLADAARDIRAALAILHTTPNAAVSNSSASLRPHTHKVTAAADVRRTNERALQNPHKQRKGELAGGLRTAAKRPYTDE